MLLFSEVVLIVENLSVQIPLELYVFFGGFVEELIAFIPSPLIMVSAGSLAFKQGHSFSYTLFLVLLVAVSKTIGSLVIYCLADKLEDIFLLKFGKFFGVSHKEVEAIGKRFDKTWKDDFLVFFLRAVPVFPGTPVAVISGLIKLNLKTYIGATFMGVWVRSLFFAVIGYYGISQFNDLFASIENIVKFLLVLTVFLFGLYFVYRKKDQVRSRLLKLFKKMFPRKEVK